MNELSDIIINISRQFYYCDKEKAVMRMDEKVVNILVNIMWALPAMPEYQVNPNRPLIM